MTTMTPGMQLPPGGQPRLAVRRRRVESGPAGCLVCRIGRRRAGAQGPPLSGRVLITEPIEDSAARMIAGAGAVSTGSPVLDRLLAGPGFLDAGL